MTRFEQRLFVQLSDLHVVPKETEWGLRLKTEEHARRAIASVLNLSVSPEAVVITGDLVDAGTVAEYLRLAELLELLPMPVYLLPGNHDERDALRDVFLDRGHHYLGREGEVLYSAEVAGLRIVALDTLVLGQGAGRVSPECLDFLRREVETSKTPVVVCQHHPPFETGLRSMDEMGLENAGEELALLSELARKGSKVRAVLCGHLHRTMHCNVAGSVAMTSPSTAHALDFELGRAPLAVRPEPPGFFVHRVCGDEAVSHLVFVDEFHPRHVVG